MQMAMPNRMAGLLPGAALYIFSAACRLLPKQCICSASSRFCDTPAENKNDGNLQQGANTNQPSTLRWKRPVNRSAYGNTDARPQATRHYDHAFHTLVNTSESDISFDGGGAAMSSLSTSDILTVTLACSFRALARLFALPDVPSSPKYIVDAMASAM